MRIDAHQHFWRYKRAEYGWIDDSMDVLRRDFRPTDLKPQLDDLGFDACVAVQARQTPAETTWLLQLADTFPFIAGVVGWVDLQSPDIERELEVLSAHPKLVGVRHIVQSEPDDFLLRPDFLRGIALLRRFDLPYDILIYPRHLKTARDFVVRFPDQRFVLDHMAKPEIRTGAIDEWRTDLKNLARLPNIYCKLSGLMTEADWRGWTEDELRPYLDVAFECFGADRLMIGSDWPVCTLAAPYDMTMTAYLDYLIRCSDAERAAVLGGTAERFYLERRP